MSQYPSPYAAPQQTPGNYPFGLLDQYLGPAKRASILMLILGAMGLVCGFCIGIVVAVAPMGDVIASSGMQLPSQEQLGMPPEQFVKIVYMVLAGAFLLGSVLLILLAIFVRKGSMAATITALILVGLILAGLGLCAISEVIRLSSGSGLANAAVSLTVVVVALGMFGLLFAMLIGAARAILKLRVAQMQYQMQYWQYAQQQQMYAQQAGYGYPQPPQAPPPVNPPNPGIDPSQRSPE